MISGPGILASLQLEVSLSHMEKPQMSTDSPSGIVTLPADVHNSIVTESASGAFRPLGTAGNGVNPARSSRRTKPCVIFLIRVLCMAVSPCDDFHSPGFHWQVPGGSTRRMVPKPPNPSSKLVNSLRAWLCQGK